MAFRESESIELKSIATEDIKKEIVAFANCEGGRIVVGVADNGEILGVESPDGVIQRVSNMVRDSIKPDLTMFVRYEALEEQGFWVVCIDVQRGANRPYYLAKKGLRPEGVYVRQGTSSAPATETAIRSMIKETDGDSFESMRSIEQDLTFESAKREFDSRKVPFGEVQMRTLKMQSPEGIFTNLALLLSDQCVHTIKAATFEGIGQEVFKDRREFTGSLLKQVNDVYEYIDLRNQTRSTFEGLRRTDSRSYPEAAVREALLNCVVHRDYSFRASSLISVYSDRIEFVSIGGLLPGVSLDDVMLGLSVCRNPQLANVFYRLELIEAYGTGMRKIVGSYEGTGKLPQITVTSNAMRVVLPNLNASDSVFSEIKEVDSAEEKVLQLASRKGSVSRRDVEDLLRVGQSTAGRVLKRLLDSGLLVRYGSGKGTKYRLVVSG